MNTIDYSYATLNEIFTLSETSPSGLAFKVNVYGGKNNKQVLRKALSPAGGKNYYAKTKVPFAWRVTYMGVTYQLHRVVYILYNKTEIPEGFVIDHLNGDPFDNSVENLALKSVRANNQNVKKNSRNKTNFVGVFLECAKGRAIAYTATWRNLEGIGRSKRFYFTSYTEEKAFELAVEFRRNKIQELKDLGMSYTDRHGN